MVGFKNGINNNFEDVKDRKRDEYIKQLKSPNIYNAALNAVSKSIGQQQQLLQTQMYQQSMMSTPGGSKQKSQTSLYESGATGTILEEEEEEEEEEVIEEVVDEQHGDKNDPTSYLSPPIRSTQNGNNKQGSFDSSSLSPPIESRSQPSPRPNNQQTPSPKTNNQTPVNKQRPIVETHKFDSLEVL